MDNGVMGLGLAKMTKMSFSGNEEDALFVNDGEGHFEDRCFQSRLDVRGDGRSSVFADFDGDGDPDLLLRQLQRPKLILFRNEAPPGHWLRVELQGKKSNRMGVGALVRARFGAAWQTRLIRAGHGYLSQGPAEAHFGLGAGASKSGTVEVRWPSGLVQTVESVPADK